VDAVTSDQEQQPVRLHRLPVRRILLAAFAIVAVLIILGLRSPISINVTSVGTEYRSTSHFYFKASFLAFSVITGCLGFLYTTQKGFFRLLGVALFGVTGWLIYTAATADHSNHHVLVTDTTITSEVGTRSNPIVHQIDLSQTAYIQIVEHTQNNRPYFELVAHADADGHESRIPIHGLMRAALPTILEAVSQHDIIIGESDTGGLVPGRLQQMIPHVTKGT
jgi:hypothetical protein